MMMSRVEKQLEQAVARAQALPEVLTEADFEVVEWDGQEPINGATAETLRGGELADAVRVLLVRERRSRLVFVVQPMGAVTGEPLRSDADVEREVAVLRRDVLPRAVAIDPSGPVTALLRNTLAAAGVSPQQMAELLGGLRR